LGVNLAASEKPPSERINEPDEGVFLWG